MADTKVSALTEISVPALEDLHYTVDDPSGTPVSNKISGTRMGGLLCRNAVGGRLTLTSGTPITTADVTGATTVYFSPLSSSDWCGLVSLYDGTRWKLYTFTEISLALGTLTSGKPYDVFLYDNSGTLTLEFLVWTNDTTRATALTTQDGIYVKTGATTRRYLGTFYTTATTTTEDSAQKRLLYNYYNRVERPLRRLETNASWTHTVDLTWRQANGSTSNQVEVMAGVNETPVFVQITVEGENASAGATNGTAVGEDSTTTPHTACQAGRVVSTAAAEPEECNSSLYTFPNGAGRHTYVWLEYRSVGNATWRGVLTSTIQRFQYGMYGHCFA